MRLATRKGCDCEEDCKMLAMKILTFFEEAAELWVKFRAVCQRRQRCASAGIQQRI
jgi:hypothetical protein